MIFIKSIREFGEKNNAIKTFGDRSSRAYNITERDFCLNTIRGMKYYLENTLAHDVLVIGFNPVWDAATLRVFP
jgi:hypothetical protein